MPTNLSALGYTITSLVDTFLVFFKGDPQDVTFKYMDQNGNVKTYTVPNVAKVTQELKENSVTDAELAEKLKNYYSKIEVNSIKNAILKKFDEYYTKKDLDNIVNNKVNEINNRINEVETEAKNLINDVKEKALNEALSSRVLTRAEYEAIAETNRNTFTGSGLVKASKKYGRLSFLPLGGLATWKKTDPYFTQTQTK